MAQGFRAQAVQVMENIKIALSAVGGSFDNVVKLNKVQAVDDRDLNFPTGQQSLPTEGKAIKFLAHCNKTCQNRLNTVHWPSGAGRCDWLAPTGRQI